MAIGFVQAFHQPIRKSVLVANTSATKSLAYLKDIHNIPICNLNDGSLSTTHDEASLGNIHIPLGIKSNIDGIVVVWLNLLHDGLNCIIN